MKRMKSADEKGGPSDGNWPIRGETTNPFNEKVMETKHW